MGPALASRKEKELDRNEGVVDSVICFSFFHRGRRQSQRGTTPRATETETQARKDSQHVSRPLAHYVCALMVSLEQAAGTSLRVTDSASNGEDTRRD